MGKLREVIWVIGEGPTEFYYFNGLKDLYRKIDFKPTEPSHSSLHDYEKKIKEGIEAGVSKILCVIDMDNKRRGTEKNKYDDLKKRYSKNKKSKIGTQVLFFETDPCTELFFLYYFSYVTKYYENQDGCIKDLHSKTGYEKKKEFFEKHPLNDYFIKQKGSLETAITFSEKSSKEIEEGKRDYTYSQIGDLFSILEASNNK